MGTVTVLRAASARSAASTSVSDPAGGSVDGAGSVSRMAAGTAVSASSSMLDAPIAASMVASSPGRGPM